MRERETAGIRDRDGKETTARAGVGSPLTDRLTGYDIVCLQT